MANDRHLDPPDELEAPECGECDGTCEILCERCNGKGCRQCGQTGFADCDTCNGTGYQPAPDFEPDFDPEYDTPPYEGP